MNRAHGFTIPELMITIAVLSILLVIAIPSFQTLVQNNRMTSQINEFTTALLLARSEAVKRNVPVMLCAVDDPAPSPLDCDGTNWETGWMVVADADSDDTVAADAEDCDTGADCVLAVSGPLQGGNTLRGTSGPNTLSSITYLPTGAAEPTGFFTLCDDRGGDHAKAVVVTSTGRPRASETEPDGSDLGCT